ncbi:MAG: hypothetical protein EUB_03738 [Eubacterium sp.]|uniref:hypothetical protein n=1 Tax=Eubacterium sp. TaxID=142586 RepID=UPI003061FC09
MKKCEHCGKSFNEKVIRRRKYCSEECAYKAKRENIRKREKIKSEKCKTITERICPICGNHFIPVPSNSRKKYCTTECARKAEQERMRKNAYSTLKTQKRKKSPSICLVEAVEKARIEGVSYGVYVAKRRKDYGKSER